MTATGKQRGIERIQPAAASTRRAQPALKTPPKRSATSKPTRDRARSPEDFKTSTLSVRIKTDVREQATATLGQLGISLSEAVRVFLGRVASEGTFPFPLEVPNERTAAALRESRLAEPPTFATAKDIFDALEKGGKR